jgi:hypothetical protein
VTTATAAKAETKPGLQEKRSAGNFMAEEFMPPKSWPRQSGKSATWTETVCQSGAKLRILAMHIVIPNSLEEYLNSLVRTSGVMRNRPR